MCFVCDLVCKSYKFHVTTGERVLAMTDVPDDQIYRTKLKQISLCFQILRSALAGGYVNFGVFQLYGDECHMNAINMFIKLLGALPERALMVC